MENFTQSKLFNHQKNRINQLFFWILAALLLGFGSAFAQNIVYPPNSGVTNMLTDPRYKLRPNDPAEATYNSTQIQLAIDSSRGRKEGKISQLLYFPNGTYYVNKKLSVGTTNGTSTTSRNLTFQGQSREGTVLRLVDNTPGFNGFSSTGSTSTSSNPVLVIYEGTVFNNNAMGNYVKNLTIDIGANNTNATGLDFHNNNYGGIADVTIRSSDSELRGQIGLKMTRELTGIGYIKNLKVEGFNFGIKTGVYIEDYVFEDIELVGQKIAGVENTDKPLQFRRLTSINKVPAIINTSSSGHIVIIDSDLRFTGDTASKIPAIDNRKGFLFVRNVKSNYPITIQDSVGADRTAELNDDGEFSSHGVYTLLSGGEKLKSMNMPVKDAPEVPWDEDFANWVVVDPLANGEGDDTDLINAAIASGKSTVCIRYGTINIDSTIKFPDNHKVKRFISLGQYRVLPGGLLSTNSGTASNKRPVFEIGTGANDALVIEGIRTTDEKVYQYIQNNSTKSVILRNNSLYGSNKIYRNNPGAGTLFIEDIATLAENPYLSQQNDTAFYFNHQEVYARSFNPENIMTYALNEGGKLWVMGFKTEGIGTCFETTAGGFTK